MVVRQHDPVDQGGQWTGSFDLERRERAADCEPLREDAAAGEHRLERHGAHSRRRLRGFVGTAGLGIVASGLGCQRLVVGADIGLIREIAGWNAAIAAAGRLLRRLSGTAAAGRLCPGGIGREPLLECRENGRFDAVGLGPGEPLGGRVAAAVFEALFGRRAAAGLVHAGKRPGPVLRGQPCVGERVATRRQHSQGQRKAAGEERIAGDRQPSRHPESSQTREHAKSLQTSAFDVKVARRGSEPSPLAITWLGSALPALGRTDAGSGKPLLFSLANPNCNRVASVLAWAQLSRSVTPEANP